MNLGNIIEHINQKYPSINYGGCGTFSYHLSKLLHEKHGIKSEIVYIESDTPPAGKPDYDIKFSHILVKIGNKFIDNNGIYNNILTHKYLDFSKLEEMIKIPELWNNIYDHNQTPYLISDLDRLL